MVPAPPLANGATSSKAGSRGHCSAFPCEPQVPVRRMGTPITRALPVAQDCWTLMDPSGGLWDPHEAERLGCWDLRPQGRAFLVSQSPWGLTHTALELEGNLVAAGLAVL